MLSIRVQLTRPDSVQKSYFTLTQSGRAVVDLSLDQGCPLSADHEIRRLNLTPNLHPVEGRVRSALQVRPCPGRQLAPSRPCTSQTTAEARAEFYRSRHHSDQDDHPC